jgi:hypothetical protein
MLPKKNDEVNDEANSRARTRIRARASYTSIRRPLNLVVVQFELV